MPSPIVRPGSALLLALAAALPAAASPVRSPQAAIPEAVEIPKAQYRWAQSPHGTMLARILPQAIEPGDLPEPRSEGARLTVKYCVQCHHLPSPRMHTAGKWEPIVARMNWRMQGHGNLGELMREMMVDVMAPGEAELATLTRYLQKHALRAIDSKKYPELATPAGRMFDIACSQCHATPDPKSHTARDWPAVVERMQRHMSAANIVTGSRELRTHPELKTGEIVKFLQRHSRPAPAASQ